MKTPYVIISQRYLPHWELDGATYFTTDATANRWTLPPEARSIVLSCLLHFNHIKYELDNAVVMPDHFHTVITPTKKDSSNYWSIASIRHSWKSFSAKQIKRLVSGSPDYVWQHEGYDHLIRDKTDYDNFIYYVACNPVRKRLASTPEEYPWYYSTDLRAT